MTSPPRPPRTRARTAPTRREFLWQVVAAASASACGGGSGAGEGTDGDSSSSTSTGSSTEAEPTTSTTSAPTTGTTGEPGPELPGPPFTLGVASGDPLADRVILWTRLAPDPLAGGGMPEAAFVVAWELATDEAFADVVASGEAIAEPAFAHAVHVDATGLSSDSWYFYRFRVGEHTSAVGRTRTLPAPDSAPERLRLASASCQRFTTGYYTAYAHLAAEDLDLVLFLGDYIYENGDKGPVRDHVGDECRTLLDYRNRYAQYRGDLNLQAAHHRFPWAVIWDDHEVDNNYVADISSVDDPEFMARRTAAYQAFYEHMPIRVAPPAADGSLAIYRNFSWGDLAEVFLLDTRQYRTDQLCLDEPGEDCGELETEDGDMLGPEQEAWLTEGLAASPAIWKLVAQQIVFSKVDFSGLLINWDQWDGYPKARQRMLDFLAGEQLANVVILAGDLHVGGMADVNAVAGDSNTPVVAVEIVTTSITSSSETDIPPETIEQLVGTIPQIKHFNAHSRGYVSIDVTRDALSARFMIVDTIESETATVDAEAELTVLSGVPGVQLP
ncbi:alkaline phosphatase D family protein [Nannocystis radixulma]|uniref:Alkaline phosphatase D family protein n=1 Tax=Nannocystis radixulma TaxID=2995305 RepID=A0ABT5BGV3_9BACT|nr:alkaline phosphatase D family protein [Nannocystis radixulma]MDC0673370.1 alkaline phosphatase D family protein [Nannocystis radixulma]